MAPLRAALAVEGSVIGDAISTLEGWSAVRGDETAFPDVDPPTEC